MILVFGKSGQVATELAKYENVECFGWNQADQIDGPTSAASITAARMKMGETLCETRDATGNYHFSGAPDCSWADFAREICSQAGVTCDVTDIPSSDFPTTAKRPSNSRLDCTLTQDVFGIPRTDWKADLADVLQDLPKA